jgi:hypothetical protein
MTEENVTVVHIEERLFGAFAAEAYGSKAAEPGAAYWTPVIAVPSNTGTMAATIGGVTGPRFDSATECEAAVEREIESGAPLRIAKPWIANRSPTGEAIATLAADGDGQYATKVQAIRAAKSLWKCSR